jgi:hypothetical protein
MNPLLALVGGAIVAWGCWRLALIVFGVLDIVRRLLFGLGLFVLLAYIVVQVFT